MVPLRNWPLGHQHRRHSLLPKVLVYFPARQGLQVLAPNVPLNLPGGQLLQRTVSRFENLPAVHVKHSVLPFACCACPARQPTHAFWPGMAWNLPPGQPMHFCIPARALNFPLGHVLHLNFCSANRREVCPAFLSPAPVNSCAMCSKTALAEWQKRPGAQLRDLHR